MCYSQVTGDAGDAEEASPGGARPAGGGGGTGVLVRGGLPVEATCCWDPPRWREVARLRGSVVRRSSLEGHPVIKREASEAGAEAQGGRNGGRSGDREQVIWGLTG